MRKHPIALTLLGITAVGGILAVLELTNSTHLFHNAPTSAATREKQENSATTPQQTEAEGTQDKNTGKPTAAGPGSDFVLIEPNGNFVSNHHAYLHSKQNFNIEQSVCTTTSGATCQITFTNTVSGLIKHLEARMTDAGGSAYWTWKLQDAGLTAGDWRVTAIAKHGTSSKIAQDPKLLEIRE